MLFAVVCRQGEQLAMADSVSEQVCYHACLGQDVKRAEQHHAELLL